MLRPSVLFTTLIIKGALAKFTACINLTLCGKFRANVKQYVPKVGACALLHAVESMRIFLDIRKVGSIANVQKSMFRDEGMHNVKSE